MRHMKNLIALILTVAMLLTSMSVAFGAISGHAATCEALGMIKGSGGGVTAEYLATTPTRKQAALMYLRLKNLEDEALAYTGTEKFDDQDQAGDYWQPILSYLKAHPELGWIGTKVVVEGVEKTNFEPNKLIIAQAYVKVMLEALGYRQDIDFTWNEVFTFAATVGLSKPDDPFTVDSLCTSTVEALKATNAEGEQMYKELFTDEIAMAAGLIPEPTELKAVKASMDNLAEVVVMFNKDVDVDNVEDNIEVEVDGSDCAIVDWLVDDNVVTVLLSQGEVDQQDDVTITVLEEIGIEEDTQFTLTNVLDIRIPEVINVVTSGPNAFDVTFSEPLCCYPDEVKLNNGAIYAYVDWLAFNEGDSVVTIKAGAALTNGKSYTLDLADAHDYAGYDMIPYSTTVTYDEATDRLTVKVTEVTEKYVLIEFNEDLKDVPGTDSFYHSFSSYNATGVDQVDGSMSEFKVHFADHYVPYASVIFKVLADEISEDVWGNEMLDDYVTTIHAKEDKEDPTVEIVDVTETTLTIEYSEEVDDPYDKDNYLIKNDDDDEFEIDDIDGGEKDNQFILTYDEQLAGGQYIIEISNIKDTSLSENEMDPDPTILPFTVTDKTAPDLDEASAVLSDNVIYVTYPEAMDKNVLDEEAYRGISGSGVDAVQIIPESVEWFGTSKEEVKLIFDEDADLDDDNDLIVGRVSDASGNKVDAISTAIEVENADDAQILGVTTLSETTLMIEVEGKVVEGIEYGNIWVEGAEVNEEGYVASIDKVVFNDDGNTEITVGLPWNITLAAAEIDLYVVLDDMETDKGCDVDDNYTGATDGIAPSYVDFITGASLGVTSVALVFDELLESDYEDSAAFDLVIEVDGDELRAIFDYTTSVSGSALVIIFTADSDPTGLEMTIDTVAEPEFIQDDNCGNAANPMDDALEFDEGDNYYNPLIIIPVP